MPSSDDLGCQVRRALWCKCVGEWRAAYRFRISQRRILPSRRSYLVTFIFPSAALMPMEYCLPLMDTFDFVDDLEGIQSYRNFVLERTGVELTIES